MRRTSSIDVWRPDGLDGDLVVDARARDLATLADGTGTVLGFVRLRLRLGRDHRLLEVEELAGAPEAGAPEAGALDAGVLAPLVGTRVGSGFRAVLDEELATERDARTLLYLLLDDLPGATLISGYALQRAAFDAGRKLPLRYDQVATRANICAGWADGATILDAVRRHQVIPVPIGPPAPTLEPPDDPVAWHASAPLPPSSTRRRRLLDVGPAARHQAGGERVGEGGAGAETLPVHAHFRDSHVDAAGLQTVLHEYAVEGTVDPGGEEVRALHAHAHVLPWTECPAAVGSAGRLAGARVADLRQWVRQELTGVHTCTHLNDTLRSLTDVGALVGTLGR